jgi:hypothetical protein
MELLGVPGAKVVEYVKTLQDDLRAHGIQSPNGYVDGYQFLLSLSAHGERHAQQIAEVKAAFDAAIRSIGKM